MNSVFRSGGVYLVIALSVFSFLSFAEKAYSGVDPYCDNCWRIYGEVLQTYNDPSADWRAVIVGQRESNRGRFECINASAIGCHQLQEGDYVVVEGVMVGVYSDCIDGEVTENQVTRVYRWDAANQHWELWDGDSWEDWP